MPKMMGLFMLIPAAVLLTFSFFVLFTISKVEKGKLKAFGYAVVAILWLVAALIFSKSLHMAFSCGSMKGCPMQEMMKGKMGGMMQGSQQGAPMMREQTDNPGMKR